MPRLLFEKTGDSVWISHLDLMRVFQRAFRRAGLLLKHSQGFNPRAIVSIALPLSVGVDSVCELLDFELEGETQLTGLAVRLNGTLPAGIRVLDVYDSGRRIKELTHLRVRITLEYDRGIPGGAAEAIAALFARDSLVMEKRSKRGVSETDILPMIRTYCISAADANTLLLEAVICAQNPSLNPQMIISAIGQFCPDFAPDFARCSRLEILDEAGQVFR